VEIQRSNMADRLLYSDQGVRHKNAGPQARPGFSQLTVCCLLPGHLRYCSSPNTANPFCVPTKTLPLTIMGVPKRLAEPN
jgi:hypothetical protein